MFGAWQLWHWSGWDPGSVTGQRYILLEGWVGVHDHVPLLLAPHVRHVRREMAVGVVVLRVLAQQFPQVGAAASQL